MHNFEPGLHRSLSTGLQILYKKPKKQTGDLLSFLKPFSPTLWICLLGAYFLVSLCLYWFDKISTNVELPCENKSTSRTKRAKQEKEQSKNHFGLMPNHPQSAKEMSSEGQTFSVKDSMWFVTASILQQGIDILPK